MNETQRCKLLWFLCSINALSAIAAHPLMLAVVSYGKTVVVSRYHGLEVDGIVETTSTIPPLYGSENEPDVAEHLTFRIFEYPRVLSLAATFILGANAVLLGLLAYRRSVADETLPEHLDARRDAAKADDTAPAFHSPTLN
jgi:hypothetical protein